MRESEGINHAAGVFADRRRVGIDCHHLAIDAHRTAHRVGLHAIGQGHRLHELQMGGLRIGQSLRIAIDWCAGHPGWRKAGEPAVGGVIGKARFEQVAQVGLIGGERADRLTSLIFLY